MLRTHTCGELRLKNVNTVVTLSGWVSSIRNHGGLIFMDLRDHYGITQIVFDPQKNTSNINSIVEEIGLEWVVKITGKIIARQSDVVNSKISTGEIEILAQEIEVLSKSIILPFEISDKTDAVNENLRLKYRYLDLRRSKLQNILSIRDKYIQHIRNYFHANGFMEVQTPILANSSPEGARDFLVPSRLYPGKFYALPQAPQQFKQLLMVGGIDKYFQIAPCFRDEDPRLDRHYGEFYQLDMEMSFVEQEDVFAIMEPLMKELIEKFSSKKICNLLPNGNFQRLTWKEAMEKYGSDKPDLRFGLEIIKIDDLVENSGFAVFDKVLKNKGVVHALKIDGGAKFTRSELDNFEVLAKKNGAGGLAYLTLNNDALVSPLIKFLGEQKLREIATKVKAQNGDVVFFAADDFVKVCSILGAVRSQAANLLGLKDNARVALVWIVDFPMYSYSEIETDKIDFSHNPFCMPQGGLKALQEKSPLEILAYQYDLVFNGFEISSGAIRNHDPEIMYEAFKIAGYTREQVDNKFRSMITAFTYGAPPHGGNAPGIDRILMLLNDVDSIRDIYAFPKDGQGKDLMSNAPSSVEPNQLKDLHLRLVD